MKTILCDINVILDIFLKREPFYNPAATLFSKVENGEVKGFLCALSFPTLFYLLSKSIRKEQVVKTLEKIRIVFQVAPVSEKVIDLSLTGEFKDFEDAVQYYSAVQVGAEFFVTRNKRDFTGTKMPVFTPEEFLSFLHV